MKSDKQEFLVIKEEQDTFTAKLGNIQWFSDEVRDKKYEKVLLRNIKDSSGYEVSLKDWFSNHSFIKLAKKHYNNVKFSSLCKQFVLKTNKGPKLICEFKYISDIEGY